MPARYAAEHLEHGYALTGHAAQGLTIDQAFVLVRAEGALAEWGYVATSRARAETHLYAVGPELVHDAGLPAAEPQPTSRRLADALTRTAAGPPTVTRPARTQRRSSPAELTRDLLQRGIRTAERQLVATRQEFDDLGWLGRRRHGPALRQRINRELRTLVELRAELRDHPAPDLRPLSAEPSPIPQPCERSIRQPIDRGIGLEG